MRLRFDEGKGDAFADSAIGEKREIVTATGSSGRMGRGHMVLALHADGDRHSFGIARCRAMRTAQSRSAVATWMRPHLRPNEPKEADHPDGVILSRADADHDGRGWQLISRPRQIEISVRSQIA